MRVCAVLLLSYAAAMVDGAIPAVPRSQWMSTARKGSTSSLTKPNSGDGSKLSSSIIIPEADVDGRAVATTISGGSGVSVLGATLSLFFNWAPPIALLIAMNHVFPHLLKDLLACWHRLMVGGFVVSAALVVLAVPQAVRLSGGVLPTASAVDILRILINALPTQTIFKTIQYFSLRSIKFGLDGLVWMPYKTLNTIVSYGLTATVMQCAAYNNAIMNTYRYYGLPQLIFHKYDVDNSGFIDMRELKAALKDAKADDCDADVIMAEFDTNKSKRIELDEFKLLLEKCRGLKAQRAKSVFSMFLEFLRGNVLPGILFSFVRECGATGAGIVVSPHVRTMLKPAIGEWHPIPAKILSGILGGMVCSLMTQWLHNNSLRAGNIYQYTGALPSTLEVLGLTWKELGWRMFYLNADRRVLSTATATTVLTVIDIFA